MVWIFISLMIGDTEHISLYLWATGDRKLLFNVYEISFLQDEKNGTVVVAAHQYEYA